MEKKPLRALHLHTIDSLCADLISVPPVGVGKDDEPFQLASDAARSVLNWYHGHKNKWAGNVQSMDVEAIVDCIAKPPDSIPEAVLPSPQEKKRYTLVSIRAHQFGWPSSRRKFQGQTGRLQLFLRAWCHDTYGRSASPPARAGTGEQGIYL